jgi:alkylated DNA repair dioxygenase AlkB
MNEKFPNIINQDGEVISYGKIFSDELSAHIFDELSNKISWMNETVIMFGKAITTKRKVAFYANEGISYTYSKITKNALQWLPALEQVKLTIEQYTGQKYNACLLNYYHNGNEGMGWHADNEKEIITHSSIASVSIGANRKFSFKHKISKEVISVILENGSLIEMKGELQQYWLHSLPKSLKVTAPRINLTFRQMHAL